MSSYVHAKLNYYGQHIFTCVAQCSTASWLFHESEPVVMACLQQLVTFEVTSLRHRLVTKGMRIDSLVALRYSFCQGKFLKQSRIVNNQSFQIPLGILPP